MIVIDRFVETILMYPYMHDIDIDVRRPADESGMEGQLVGWIYVQTIDSNSVILHLNSSVSMADREICREAGWVAYSLLVNNKRRHIVQSERLSE